MEQRTTLNDQMLLSRITARPTVLGGKPTIRGTRLSAQLILNLLAHGAKESEILLEYEGLQPEDLTACLLFTRYALDLRDHSAAWAIGDLPAAPQLPS